MIFDRYENGVPCPKEHERARRGCSKEVRLTVNTPLPKRETVLNNSCKKDNLNNVLCSYSLPNNIELVNKVDCIVSHIEADVTLCSYMLKAAEEGLKTIRILSDDTDIFVLLVYWTSRKGLTVNIQMEKWNGEIVVVCWLPI